MPLEPPYDAVLAAVCLPGIPFNFLGSASSPAQDGPGIPYSAARNCTAVYVLQEPDCTGTTPCAAVANLAGVDYEAIVREGYSYPLPPQDIWSINGLAAPVIWP